MTDSAGKAMRPGRPLSEVTDPFVLGVHRPITLEDTGPLPALPKYVPRAHDERLAEVVKRATAGGSAMAVLVAGSSVGKTRACWEALVPLRAAGGWRLWDPIGPTRSEALLQTLSHVKPHTVVWLNEIEEYLNDEDGERVAATLRTLLTDPLRAPVLVLGTLRRQQHDALTQRSRSQVRQVLDGTVIEVPEAFTGRDLAALKWAATADTRLAWVVEHAKDGEITQCITGGPVHVERFRGAPLEAKAIMWAAMDARRMGHRNALPLALLQAAAEAYLDDDQLNRLGEDWLEQALTYTSRLCERAPGPVTPIRLGLPRGCDLRPNPIDEKGGGPVYRLVDHLDRYGRTHRADGIPPLGFWTAMAAHAHPGDLESLGGSAWCRGLYRDAAQLYKKATTHGDPHAARALLMHMHALHPLDRRPATHAADHTALGDPDGVGHLLEALRQVEATDQITALLARDPATHVSLNDPYGVAYLLHVLRKVQATDQITALLARDPATHVSLNDPHRVAYLLHVLREVQATDQINALVTRAATHTPLDDQHHVGHLLGALREVQATDQINALVTRAATHPAFDNPYGVGHLLGALRDVQATGEFTTLLTRAATHTPLDDPDGVAYLLRTLRNLEATDEFTALVTRAATHPAFDNPDGIALLLRTLRNSEATDEFTALLTRAATRPSFDNPHGVAYLLDALREVQATDQITALLARDPATHVSLNDPFVAHLLDALWKVEGTSQVAALLARGPATHTPLNDPHHVAYLLDVLRRVKATDQITALLARDPATHTPLNDPYGVAHLLGALRQVEATDQIAILVTRAASHTPLHSPKGVAQNLRTLRRVDATDQITALLARDPATRVMLDSPGNVENLLDALRQVEATDQIATLVGRLPGAGLFSEFMKVADHEARFRYGREPNGLPAAAWDWDDL